MRGERGSQRDQRVELQEPLHVVAADEDRRRGEDEEQEKEQKNGLPGTAQPDEQHG